jgi:hypothetical protein
MVAAVVPRRRVSDWHLLCVQHALCHVLEISFCMLISVADTVASLLLLLILLLPLRLIHVTSYSMHASE